MDSGQTMAVIVLLIFGGVVAGGLIAVKRFAAKNIVPPVRRAKNEVVQSVTDWDKARIERYKNLPPLGQARSDIRSAKMAKYGGTVAYGVLATIVFSIAGVTGGWIVPLALGGRWVRRNWKEQSDAIQEAEQRREQILHS